MKKILFPLLLAGLLFCGVGQAKKISKSPYLDRASRTITAVYTNYSIPSSPLLRENYPHDKDNKVGYLADQQSAETVNEHAFLWPYSGMLSAVSACMEASPNNSVFPKTLEKKVLPGLDLYYDPTRTPAAYSSYTNVGKADRYYDDNVWLGIDFTDLYLLTRDKKYLDKATMIWKFIESGTDDKLGGGIYWCEQKKGSKNTCSNAPGSVYALKLYLATLDESYLAQGINLYQWTKKNLLDTTDMLYWDNINLRGQIGKAKYAYNSGQMIQAAALLYTITQEQEYLSDAQSVAKASYNYFFYDFAPADSSPFRLLKKGNVWFSAVMFRGFIELYQIDKNRTYIDSFEKSLNWAWENGRDKESLFGDDWSGAEKKTKKWLLTQAAMAEMFARMEKLSNFEKLSQIKL